MSHSWLRFFVGFLSVLLFSSNISAQNSQENNNVTSFDRGDNGLWMRRYWIHEQPTQNDIRELVHSLRERGIKRIYPFLGPMNKDGWPGWRSNNGLVLYSPEHAGQFFKQLKHVAPEIQILPWTGGNLKQDVNLSDVNQRLGFVRHVKQIVDLGADGIHINVEPLPSWHPGYLELLDEIKAAIGNHTLSIAAYPPPTELHPFPDVHWELGFLREVCMKADELSVMAYDTAVTSPKVFEDLITRWTLELNETLLSPSKGGCEWLMGVPAYDDDKGYHRPDVETIEHSLNGINAALKQIKVPDHFRGVAIYASFTTDQKKWSVYNQVWRGDTKEISSPPPDPKNKPVE